MNEIVQTARGWLGTPFHHQARLKGKGCDCLGLFIGVAKELDIKSHVSDNSGNLIPIASFDITTYSRQPNTAKLIGNLDTYLDHVDKINMAVGDIALIMLGKNPQHLGIITDYIGGGFGLLHSSNPEGVVEHRLDDRWFKSIYKLYRLK